MASSKSKNKAGGFVVGPILVVLSLGALWKNETRFDYHKAAKKTGHVATLEQAVEGQNFSYSGEMDTSRTLSGKYIETFTGYLEIRRSAEIYCWDRDEDSDGDVTWRKTWMSSVESNSRNSGLRQELSSGRMLPPSYQVGDLEITAKQIEFVDARVDIDPAPLTRTAEGERLTVEGDYLMLRKGKSDNLGDERIGYRAIPIPPRATYFGQLAGGKGVADTSEAQSGMINSIIQNTGILHHLVAGERETALSTMKLHIQRLKWLVRGIGSAVTVFGMIFFFSSLVRFLYGIPVIGRIAETGAFVLALLLGLPLAGITIVAGWLVGNPIALVVIGLLLVAGIIYAVRLSKRQRKVGEQFKQELETEYGHSLSPTELRQNEVREMAGMLAAGENQLGATESKALDRFARQSGLKREEREEVLREVQESPPPLHSPEIHLRNLIRMALADGRLTPQEVRSIRDAATLAGYDRDQFRQLMNEIQQRAQAA